MTEATSTALTAGDRSFPWSGELPASWTTKPLKYLTYMNANTWSENTDPELLLQYVDIGSVNSDGQIGSTEDLLFENAPSRARRIVSEGDVLISTVRTYLRAIAFCKEASENLTCSTGFAVVTAGPTVDPKFLFYWARSSHFVDEIVSRSLGVSYPAINAAEIGNLPFPTISRGEQQQIAAFLDRKTAQLDAVLAQKERQLGLLAEKRQALISQAVTRGLDPTAPLKPSGILWLGEVPGHWEMLKLAWLFQMIGSGTTPNSNDESYYDGELPWVNTGELNDNIIFETKKSVTAKAMRDVSALTLFPVDTLLIALYGATIGKLGILGIPATTNQACCALAIPKGISMNFAFYWFIGNRRHIISMAYGGGQPNISQELIKQLRLALPPLHEQRTIVAYLDRETERIDGIAQAVRTQIEKVREYRQALISAAVTGKIDVRGEEKADISAYQD